MTDTRTAFEAHFQLSSRQAKRDNMGDYINAETQARWEGYQAGKGDARIAELEKLVAQAPAFSCAKAGSGESRCTQWCGDSNQCTEAIRYDR